MEVRNKKFDLKKVPLWAVAIVLIVALAGGLYLYKSQKESAKNSLPAGWVEYKNNEYRMKFNYPKSWGTPQIEVNKFSKGVIYFVLFGVATEDERSLTENRNVKIIMETEDVIKKVCEAENKCDAIPAITKAYIQQRLVANKSSFIAYDSSSYTILSIGTSGIRDSKGNLGLNNIAIHKEVNLQKLNVSAAQGFYSKKASISNCPQKEFGLETNGCITQENYNYLNKVLSSIKPI